MTIHSRQRIANRLAEKVRGSREPHAREGRNFTRPVFPFGPSVGGRRPGLGSSPDTWLRFYGSVTLMARHIRNCVECPKCRTRYLISFSPYGNGSHLVSCHNGYPPDYILHCSCGRSPLAIRCDEPKRYFVSKLAYDRGYGSAEEIVPTSE